MGFFSSKSQVSEDYMPTRSTAAIYSDPKDRKWFVKDLAAMDAAITAEIPESETVIAILLYTRGELLVLTPIRLLLFRGDKPSNARLHTPAMLTEIRSARLLHRNTVRILIDGPQRLNGIQYGNSNTDTEPARLFLEDVLSARDKLASAS